MLDSFGLVETAKVIEDVTGEKEGYTIIEGTDMTKYRIDGKRTGTFLAKSDGELLDVAQQLFVVEDKGKGYIFGFEDSTLTFDDTETEEIMNRILESIKFVR
jgi:hypothetical protein